MAAKLKSKSKKEEKEEKEKKDLDSEVSVSAVSDDKDSNIPKVEEKVEEPKARAVKIEEVPDFSKSLDSDEIKKELDTPEENKPKDTKPTLDMTTEKEEPTNDEPKATSTRPTVSSFSLLDTQKKESNENTAASTPKTEEKPEPVVSTASSETSTAPDKEQISSDEVKKWLKDVKPDTSKEVEKSGGSFFKTLGIILLILAVIGAVVGGFFYYKASVNMSAPTNKIENPAPTVEPTQVPDASPAASLDLTKYHVEVLNGSGIAGEAGKAATALEGGGFTNVKTGNASSYDFTTTEVSLKESIPSAVYDAVDKALSTSYKVEKSSTNLESTDTYDVIITVGSSKAQ